MQNPKAEISTHESAITFSEDDDFDFFFNDIESKFQIPQPHANKVSVMTEQDHHTKSTHKDDNNINKHFTENLNLCRKTHS